MSAVWSFRHSLECDAPREFVWRYWTNIENWDDPPATFRLDGPFETGSHLTTVLPGQTFHSTIREVIPECEAKIEMQLPNAVLCFHWRFGQLGDYRTEIRQELSLTGAGAKQFLDHVRIFERSVPDGMKRLAAAIKQAENQSKP